MIDDRFNKKNLRISPFLGVDSLLCCFNFAPWLSCSPMSLRCPCRLSRSFLYCASPSSIHRTKTPQTFSFTLGIPIDPPEIIVLMLQTSGQKTTISMVLKPMENHGKTKTRPNWKPPDFLKPPTGDQVTQIGGVQNKEGTN